MRRMRIAGWAAVAVTLLLAQVVDVLGASPAVAAVGNELVTASSGYSSAATKGVTANCPAGKRILGGGARVADGDGYVALSELTPTSDGATQAFQAKARELPGGYDGLWDVQAYAICGDLVTGLVRVSAASDAPATATTHETTVNCPLGKKVIGLGGEVAGDGNTFQWIRPYDNYLHGSVRVSAVHDAGTARGSLFRVTAYAICAPPPPGYGIEATGTLAYPGRYLQTSVRCTGDRFVFGAGLTKNDPSGTSHVDEVFPGVLPGGVGGAPPGPTGAAGAAGGRGPYVVWVGTRQPAASNPINLGAWAICAN